MCPHTTLPLISGCRFLCAHSYIEQEGNVNRTESGLRFTCVLIVDCSALTVGLVTLRVSRTINVTSPTVNVEQSTINGQRRQTLLVRQHVLLQRTNLALALKRG